MSFKTHLLHKTSFILLLYLDHLIAHSGWYFFSLSIKLAIIPTTVATIDILPHLKEGGFTVLRHVPS